MKKITIIIAVLVVISSVELLINNTSSTNQKKIKIAGKLDPSHLIKSYNRWEADYKKNQGFLEGPSIGLTWNKGLSSEYSHAKGLANINLKNGSVTVSIIGDVDDTVSDVWLVDNISSQKGSSVQPEINDHIIHVGSLTPTSSGASLSTQLDLTKLNSLEIDWVVITRKDSSPIDGGVLYGSTSLFQKIFHYPQYRLSIASNKTPFFLPSLISPVSADGIYPERWFPEARLINDGRKIFFNTTFNGNGRTCGTCHPETNNFTLDPKFIATLPANDPLFVAERRQPNPLSKNFENPELMRKVGLIMENTNGFSDLEGNYTMRAVSHVLGLNTSLSPPTYSGNDGTVGKNSPKERTGWSGDGSPIGFVGDLNTQGTLRDFTVGAIRQHFTKTLQRRPGIDFRLPNEYELDALEAYMLSLGRQEEFDDFTQISMTDERADRGRLNYMGENVAGMMSCNACHFNGGANTDPNFDFPVSVTPLSHEMTNRSFAPRGEELIDQHADLVDMARNPRDDGFGSGTNLFNVPTVIEAADTGPFFHKNSIDTVEAMVAFYSSKRHLQNGEVLDPIVHLNGAQVANVGAFLRVLNADENIRSALSLLDQASDLWRRRDKKINLKIAGAEITDAIEVLEGGNLHFNDALPLLRKAKYLIKRHFSWRRAYHHLQEARELMINR